MPQFIASRPVRSAADPHLERALRTAVVAGLVLALLLPAWSHWFGWTPLWLLGMPLSAWWGLHRFRLPAPARRVRSRRRGVQARRHNPLMRKRFLRAA